MNTNEHKLRLLLVTILSLSISILTKAQKVGDKFKLEQLQYEIIKLNPAEVKVIPNNPKPKGDITIPDKVNYNNIDYSVTNIGHGAFWQSDSLKSLTIGNSVTVIESSAFSQCKTLTSVSLPSSVEYIGAGAFYFSTSLKKIVIPNSVKVIENSAFKDCHSLRCVYTKIEDLSKVKIGKEVFKYINKHCILFVPDGKTDYYKNAWKNFKNIKEEKDYSPDIGTEFKHEKVYYRINTANSASIISQGGTMYYDDGSEKPKGDITINETVNYNGNDYTITNIEHGAFYECGISSVTINGNSSIKSIEDRAFYGCRKLKQINIPKSVTNIGKFAFTGCESIIDIDIPGAVTNIGMSTFYGCYSLEKVNIPKSVTDIGVAAFSECKALKKINIPGAVTKIGESAFYDCECLESINIPDLVTSIEESTFQCCFKLKSVTIPNSVTSIGKNAFDFCSKLSSLTIGNSVANIGDKAFARCNSLKTVNIPTAVTSIAANVFEKCSSLTSINVEAGNQNYSSENGVLFNKNKTKLLRFTNGKPEYEIPNSVTEIGNGAFSFCNQLKKITFPNSIDSIGENAFLSCNYLNFIISKIEDPNKIKMGKNVFSNTKQQDCILFVPNGKVEDYKSAAQWNIFNTIKEAQNNSLLVGTKFKHDKLYYLITTNSTVRVVHQRDVWSDEDFWGETGWWEKDKKPQGDIIIPEKVDYKGKDYDVVSMERAAFFYCNTITSLILPNCFTRITPYSFRYCNILNTMVIPKSVKKIGIRAFDKCSSLKFIISKIEDPNNVKMGDNVFDGVNKSKCTLYVPNGKVAEYQKAEQWKDFKNIKEEKDLVKVESISLNKKEIELGVEDSETLEARVSPTNVTIPNVAWLSSNDTIAKVNDKGVVTAIQEGEAIITAITIDGQFSATCKITVKSATVIEYKKGITFNLYPTLVEAGFTVETDYAKSVLEIFNLMGSKILTLKLTGQKQYIDVSNLNKGVYIVKVGGKAVKFVKK